MRRSDKGLVVYRVSGLASDLGLRVGQVVVERLDLHTQPPSVDPAILTQLRHDVVRLRGGDGEADTDVAAVYNINTSIS